MAARTRIERDLPNLDIVFHNRRNARRDVERSTVMQEWYIVTIQAFSVTNARKAAELSFQVEAVDGDHAIALGTEAAINHFASLNQIECLKLHDSNGNAHSRRQAQQGTQPSPYSQNDH